MRRDNRDTPPRLLVGAGSETLWLYADGTGSDASAELLRYYGEAPELSRPLVQNEFELSRNLGVPGILVPDQVDDPDVPQCLIYRRPGLHRYRALSSIGTVPCALALQTAQKLVRSVGKLHTAGVLHLSVNPFHVLIPDTGTAAKRPTILLTGLGHAVRRNRIVAEQDMLRVPKEYWPYLAPEQTGRTTTGSVRHCMS